jgi:hypothetical protein
MVRFDRSTRVVLLLLSLATMVIAIGGVAILLLSSLRPQAFRVFASQSTKTVAPGCVMRALRAHYGTLAHTAGTLIYVNTSNGVTLCVSSLNDHTLEFDGEYDGTNPRGLFERKVESSVTEMVTVVEAECAGAPPTAWVFWCVPEGRSEVCPTLHAADAGI